MKEENKCVCGKEACKSKDAEGVVVNGEWFCSIECAGDESKKGGCSCRESITHSSLPI